MSAVSKMTKEEVAAYTNARASNLLKVQKMFFQQCSNFDASFVAHHKLQCNPISTFPLKEPGEGLVEERRFVVGRLCS